MVKDAESRFRDRPLWADGWGCALFTADDPGSNVAISYAADCKTCHVQSAAMNRLVVQHSQA